MEFNYYIGVDISKNKLDMAVFKGSEFISHKVIGNHSTAIKAFLKSLESLEGFSLSTTLFCMEHTGIYNNPLLVFLTQKKGNICLEAATQIKNSLGNIRGKNDKIDAQRIGQYAYKNRETLRLWQPKREVVVKLERVTALRDRLISAKKPLSVPLNEQKQFVSTSTHTMEQKICQRTLNSLEADIKKADQQIKEIIRSDEELNRLFNRIVSVKSVGVQTAAQIIVRTNEFKDIDEAKKFSCYSGVAPFTKQSGLFKGKGRVSHMANKKMKKLLHMSALSAIVHNSDLKAYYERKVAEGKNKMSVINAVRNKLIHRIFACVHQNRDYENNYAPKPA